MCQTRVCVRCKRELSITEFYRKKTGIDSFHSYCKTCSAEVAKERTAKKNAENPNYKPKPHVPEGHKLCPNCELVKPHSEYRHFKREQNGSLVRVYCKTCEPILRKKFSVLPEYKAKRKVKGRKDRLMKSFGLTLEKYQAMMELQDGKCAICGTDNYGKYDGLYVDHNHETGEVRALLCHGCNAGIGFLREDVNIMNSAIEYIKLYGKESNIC